MNSYFYRLNFAAAVHFGQGRLSSSGSSVSADTLFSALFNEALHLDRADELMTFVRSGELSLSDLFPYSGDTYFLPKPIMRVQSDRKGDSSLKKKFKGLTHIPLGDMDEYIRGEYDPDKAAEKLSAVGKNSLRQQVRIVDGEDNKPYSVGLFTFAEGCGLFFAASVSDDARGLLDVLMTALGLSGLGGKRSAGTGRFTFQRSLADGDFAGRLGGEGRAMSLSVCLPTDEELDRAMEGASFETVRRAGFVRSESYSETPLRKRDLYCFKAGSVFENRFEGDIYDVSANGGSHPVYRYARPMWFSVERG